MRCIRRLLLVSSLVSASLAATAGTVDVTFVNSANYWDAGTTTWDEDTHLKNLSRHLQKLGLRWLPADQALRVDVLQVDLAGTVRSFHGSTAVRLITGGADWPKIHLRYVLEAGGRPIASGEDWVTDLDFLHGSTSRGDSEALYYEKRMLDAWFKRRFMETVAAPG